MTKKSPFPGMDPFLEKAQTWGCFHGWFIYELASQIIPAARQVGLDVFVERSVYRRVPDSNMRLLGGPDSWLLQETISNPSDWKHSDGGIVTAQPRAVHEVLIDDDEQLTVHKQYFLVIREKMSDMVRDVAVAELLSPANKAGEYAEKYQKKREHFLASQSHFLEIDLLRDGANPSRERFPELSKTPYFIFLARKNWLGWNEEGFPVRLQELLPTIGLPLTPDRPILPLNLQAAFESAFNLSAFVSERLYGELPGPALSDEDQAFVSNILAHRGPIESFDE